MKLPAKLMRLLPSLAIAFTPALASTQPVNQPPSTAFLLSLMENSERNITAESELPDVHGHKMFTQACTQCHDAERSTSAHKTYDSWLTTVRRMADKSGAHIPDSEIEPIAKYLTSLNPDTALEDQHPGFPPQIETATKHDVTLNGAVSLLYRESDEINNDNNNGFFADVWVGAEWRPEGSPISVKVTACTSCHDTTDGNFFELVEGSLTADLIHLVSGQSAGKRNSDVKASLKGGRFVVPFGAFSDTVHPGTYRTLTYPLLYTMDRRVGSEISVLPMPYSDEGIDLHLGAPLPARLQVGLDVYAVNGLQLDFNDSRSYSDNNTDIAIGGRATLGNSWIRFGGSYSSGEMQWSGEPTQSYKLIGGDVTLRYLDYIRASYEYAKRTEDTTTTDESQVDGHVAEVEGMIWKKPRIGLIVRYDTLNHTGEIGEFSAKRISWGPTISLGRSVLIFNHERWMFDDPDEDEDVLGFRWIAWF